MSFSPVTKFYEGTPLMVDYTATSAVNAGDVVVFTAGVRIAHTDIASGQLGALAIAGGVYTFNKLTTASIAADTIVYWVSASNCITTASSNYAQIGLTTNAALATDGTQFVLHKSF